MLRDDFLGGAVEIARAAVVAQAGPKLEDFRERGVREGSNGRKFLEEAMIVGKHGGDTGLLQHYLGDPDAVWIAAASPGEIAFMRTEPTQQSRLEILELLR